MEYPVAPPSIDVWSLVKKVKSWLYSFARYPYQFCNTQFLEFIFLFSLAMAVQIINLKHNDLYPHKHDSTVAGALSANG